MVRETQFESGPDISVSSGGYGGDKIWIKGPGNGNVLYVDTIRENPDLITDKSLREKIRSCEDKNLSNELLLGIGIDFAHTQGKMICQQCQKAYHFGELTGVNFAGTKCYNCKKSCKNCHSINSFECINSSKSRHNARVRPKYKCKECGFIKKGIATG